MATVDTLVNTWDITNLTHLTDGFELPSGSLLEILMFSKRWTG
jgi:hypothetical protein